MTKEQAMKEYEYAKIELSFYKICHKGETLSAEGDALKATYAESIAEIESYMDYLRTQIYEEN